MEKRTPTLKTILHTLLSWSARLLALALVLAILVVGGARGVVWLSSRITADSGVDEGIFLSIGGQEQFLRIRGSDTGNPVILWLHGGPAGSDAFLNHVFQKYLVDDYTIVNWDQRGCGRTYYRNRHIDPGNTSATFEQAQQDLDELVDALCRRFATDRIILVGHSYGSMLGSKYALEHPEKVAAYIGVGQVLSLQSETYAYENALTRARAKGDDTSAMEAAHEAYVLQPNLFTSFTLRNLTYPYLPVEKSANQIWLGLSSPYMGLRDIQWFFEQNDLDAYAALNESLFRYVFSANVLDYGADFSIPVGFISGSCDWITPVAYTQFYCDSISAPQKQFMLLDGCGHSPQFDAPEEFAAILRQMLETYLP